MTDFSDMEIPPAVQYELPGELFFKCEELLRQSQNKSAVKVHPLQL